MRITKRHDLIRFDRWLAVVATLAVVGVGVLSWWHRFGPIGTPPGVAAGGELRGAMSAPVGVESDKVHAPAVEPERPGAPFENDVAAPARPA